MANKVKNIDLRSTELTGIIGRESMDKLAKVVGSNRWKQYREEYDQASQLAIETGYPIQLDFELNASCNLKCPMCPLSAETNIGKGKETWFKFEDFTRIIDEGIEHGLKAIKLNYINEPLIRKDVTRFISYAKKTGIIDIYLSTNGLLLNDTFIKEIIEAGLTRIQVSVDACTPETYDMIRPGGNFYKVLENIERIIRIRDDLQSITPLIRVNFVRTELNEHELQCFIDFWINKVDMIGIQEMIKPPTSPSEIKSKTTHDKRKEGFHCSFPFKQLVINNEGDILPCCTFYGEQLKMGNIHEDRIIDIWNSKEIRALRKLHKDGQYFDNEVCRKCVEDAISDND